MYSYRKRAWSNPVSAALAYSGENIFGRWSFPSDLQKQIRSINRVRKTNIELNQWGWVGLGCRKMSPACASKGGRVADEQLDAWRVRTQPRGDIRHEVEQEERTRALLSGCTALWRA